MIVEEPDGDAVLVVTFVGEPDADWLPTWETAPEEEAE